MTENVIDSYRTGVCQLLVSVRDSHEAALCLAAGVDWIDLKDPSAGSLGMPSMQAAHDVARVLENHRQRSVALGELAEMTDWTQAREISLLFPIAKVGLSALGRVPDWQDGLQELSCTLSGYLIPVVYADWESCEAPEPLQIARWASDQHCPFLLIDTFHKDGRRLLDHLSFEHVDELIHIARCGGTKVVLAGSLSMKNVSTLLQLPCAALAVRGAVCRGSRQGELCADRLHEWIHAVSGIQTQSTPRNRS